MRAKPRPFRQQAFGRGLIAAVAAASMALMAGAAQATASAGATAPLASATAVQGTVWTVGAGANGQLGNGSTASQSTFTQVTALPPIAQVHGGREHVVALDTTGQVWAWGDNPNGQVGDGTRVDRLTPFRVTGLTTPPTLVATSVTTGHYHSLALLSDGTVRAWGLNKSGQLGDGSHTNRLRPVQVSGLTGVVEVRAGRDLSLALKSDGTVWAWGLGSSGELGNGTTTGSPVPVRVSGLTDMDGVPDVVHIAAGRNHGLAVRANGSVWAWGMNKSGHLGDGTKTARTRPVQSSGITTAVNVVAGADHSVALLSDGRLLAWGENGRGQLGLGNTTDRTTPTAVTGLLPAVRTIGAGRDTTLAVTTTGALWAWGHDDFGQLGDGGTASRLRPAQVADSTGAWITGAVEGAGGRNYSVLLREPEPLP